MLDYIGDKRSYHVTMVILWKKEIHPPPPSKYRWKNRNRQKRIRESFWLHLGPFQYMSGDYYYEFGEMSKRRFFSRLGTSRAQ